MSEKETKVTKQETLAALRNPGELYVIMSAATKMPFVKCDEETFDDEIFLYYQMEDAKDKARKLLDEKYVSAVAKLAKEQLLPFFTSLYIMGVNALAVNSGTDMEITVQLSDLVTRNIPKELPEGKQIVENPALHLTAHLAREIEVFGGVLQSLRRGLALIIEALGGTFGTGRFHLGFALFQRLIRGCVNGGLGQRCGGKKCRTYQCNLLHLGSPFEVFGGDASRRLVGRPRREAGSPSCQSSTSFSSASTSHHASTARPSPAM